MQNEPDAQQELLTEPWEAGGTVPDADETWMVPVEDPDATWPMDPAKR